jgi:hypothetical protein
MTARPLGYKRLVLGLQAGAPNRATRLAVEFAELFDAELLGLFIEDVGLRHLAGLPSARAISASGVGWRSLEPAHAREEADRAADRAERVFGEAACRLARRRFEIARGGAARALEAISRSDDIVVIVAPAAAADRAAEPFASLLDAAFRSSAAVMLAPPRIARVTGSIVAIAAGPQDPSVETANAIAAAAGETLVVVEVRAGVGGAMRVERRSSGGGSDGPRRNDADRSITLPTRRRRHCGDWPNAWRWSPAERSQTTWRSQSRSREACQC